MQIAIVGCGSRGLLMLERMCGHLITAAARQPMTIHLIGGSRVGFRPTHGPHPDLLLTHVPAGASTVFAPADLVRRGTVLTGPTVSEWAILVSKTDVGQGITDTVRAEAAILGPHEYPTRRLYGYYLRWAFEYMRRRLPADVTVVEHEATVTTIHAETVGAAWLCLSNGRHLSGLDAVVLADPQYRMPPQHGPRDLHPYVWFPSLRPSPELTLSTIRPQQRVAIMGMGQRFTDLVTLLTSGRGGTFTLHHGALKYRRSGREPVIAVGSQQGMPPHCRTETVPETVSPVTALTQQRLSELRDRLERPAGRRPTFERDVWPLIAEETEVAYYSALLHERLSPVQLRYFQDQYLQVADASVRSDIVQSCNVDRYLHWRWDQRIAPGGGHRFIDLVSYHQWLIGHLNDDVRQARLGPVRGPLPAAAAALRALHPWVQQFLRHPTMTPLSEGQKFWYRYLYTHFAGGPPARRTEELAALIRAGIVQVIGNETAVHQEAPDGGYRLHSPHVCDSEVYAEVLIDTRPSKDGMVTGSDVRAPLYTMPGPEHDIQPDNSAATNPVDCGAADDIAAAILGGHPARNLPEPVDTPADPAESASPAQFIAG